MDTKLKSERSTSQSIGSITHYEVTLFAFNGQTNSENIKIEVYEKGIYRIRITQNENFENLSYALVGDLEPKSIDYIDKSDELVISTGLIELTIQKSPFRLAFKNAKGEILNEDDQGLGISWIGEQVTNYKKLQPNEKFVGLGEKTGPLNKRGKGYQNWNTDHFAYDIESDPIYCSVPFYIGIHQQNSYGIFFNNSHKTHFNFGASNHRFSSFSADSGELDYFFIHHATFGEIVSAYSRLTGTMSLPPKWSLGYQQCRYSYYPDAEVISTAKNFRDKKIPADTMVLDIHYMDKYKIFTWDKERFPNPKNMINDLKEMGFKIVVMCDPGIKVEKGYPAYDDGIDKDIFIKYPDGENYQGQVWPGWCHFPDFTHEKARNWWEEQLKCYVDLGIEGFWNDMNEIATWGQYMPELIEFSFEGEGATSRKARNVYGMLMAKSTLEGAKAHLINKRPFNLTRAGYAGIQRYSAVWTGDNIASDDHMLLGVRMITSMGISGIPFAGFDTGGFVGNASEDLFARWISIGAFTPFFRGHSNVNTRSSEPWTYGEHSEEIARNYISLRYKLLPYLYSAFHASSINGLPVCQSLAIDYTYDDKVYDQRYENEFLFGQSILVAPVSCHKVIEKIYIPQGTWYDLFTDQIFQGAKETLVECPMQKLPVFAKESSIIPIQSVVNNCQELPNETLELHLYKGKENSHFDYYEDDGESYDFEKGSFHTRRIEFHPKQNQLTFGAVDGKYPSHFKKVKIYYHGFKSIHIDGQRIDTENYRFLNQLTDFDPIESFDRVDYIIQNIPCFEVAIQNKTFSVQWKEQS